jgi:hypothetical protein
VDGAFGNVKVAGCVVVFVVIIVGSSVVVSVIVVVLSGKSVVVVVVVVKAGVVTKGGAADLIVVVLVLSVVSTAFPVGTDSVVGTLGEEDEVGSLWYADVDVRSIREADVESLMEADEVVSLRGDADVDGILRNGDSVGTLLLDDANGDVSWMDSVMGK